MPRDGVPLRCVPDIPRREIRLPNACLPYLNGSDWMERSRGEAAIGALRDEQRCSLFPGAGSVVQGRYGDGWCSTRSGSRVLSTS